MKFLKIFFILQNIFYLTYSKTLTDASVIPDDVMRCHFADVSCLKESTEKLLKTYSKTGLPQLNILPIDPLRVNVLKINKNPTSPVSVELKFKDIDVIGLHAAKVIKISGFDADIKNLIEVKLHVPRFEIKGTYSVNGTVLILPIIGKGKSQIVLEDVLLTAKLQPEAYIKEGHTYMKVTSSRFDIIPNHATYNLENLFNGDKILSDNMNKFLNENWLEIYNELKQDLYIVLDEIVMHIINEPFSKFPYETLFLK